MPTAEGTESGRILLSIAKALVKLELAARKFANLPRAGDTIQLSHRVIEPRTTLAM